MGNLPSIIIVVLLPSRRSLALRNLAFGIPLFGRFFFQPSSLIFILRLPRNSKTFVVVVVAKKGTRRSSAAQILETEALEGTGRNRSTAEGMRVWTFFRTATWLLEVFAYFCARPKLHSSVCTLMMMAIFQEFR